MLFRPLADFLRSLGKRYRSVPRVATAADLSNRLACEWLEERVLLSINALLVKDINTQFAASSSSPADFTDVNGTLFFTAITATAGRELWKSDGTAAGTVLVKDINPGSGFSFPSSLTNVNGTLYFAANDGTSGVELWKSDGTEAGTVQVKDIFAGSGSSLPSSLASVNGTLYFTANDGVTGEELWRSDGTAGGTVLVKDIFAGASSSSPSSLTDVNGTLFFAANDGMTGIELWKSDGSGAGTVQVQDINAGAANSSPSDLTNVNGTLYFSADDGLTGVELWKSDATAGGTVRVKDIVDGNYSQYSSTPQSLTNVNGTLYFSAQQVISVAPDPHDPGTNIVTLGNRELWKSDGTDSGTVRVQDIRPGTASSYPNSFTEMNGTLYFSANDGVAGDELWKSDGTDVGTVQVADINAGPAGSFPRLLTNVNGTLYFTANDLIAGTEVWKSDGTTAGTSLVTNIRAGLPGSSPSSLTNVNGMLFFAANDGVVGDELWGMFDVDLPTISTIPPQTILEDTVTATLPFTLTNPTGNVNALIVTATSSDTTLIPNSGIQINVTGANGYLVITPAADLNGLATITITVSDGAHTVNQLFQVRVNPVDDPAVITLNPQPLVYHVSGQRIVAVDSSATITDIDTPTLIFSGSVLTVSGQTAKDKLSVLKQNDITRKGRNLFFGSTFIGTVSGGRKGDVLAVRLNNNATKNSVQALLHSIGFESTDKVAGTRTLHIQITDVSGLNTNQATRQIQVEP